MVIQVKCSSYSTKMVYHFQHLAWHLTLSIQQHIWNNNSPSKGTRQQIFLKISMVTFLSRSEWYQYSFLVRTCLLSGNPGENHEKNVSEIYRRPYKSESAKLKRVTHIHSNLKLIDSNAPLIRLLWSLFFLSLNVNQAMISKFDFRIHVIVIQILT